MESSKQVYQRNLKGYGRRKKDMNDRRQKNNDDYQKPINNDKKYPKSIKMEKPTGKVIMSD